MGKEEEGEEGGGRGKQHKLERSRREGETLF
jgi:hypothetical protein